MNTDRPAVRIPDVSTDYDEQYTLPARSLLFNEAIKYLSQADLNLLEHACAFASDAHGTQQRKSGEPYITHPIAVTEELAKWRTDIETLCAGLMHDVLEDTGVTYDEMAAEFGTTITDLVNGVSKLDKFEYSDKTEHQAESFRKLVMAMTKDVRVIVIKLSDRLHNMRTLDGVNKVEKRRSTAQETLDIHAPIAHRLGLNYVYREMQDLAFRHIHPDRFRVLSGAMEKFRKEYVGVIEEVTDIFQKGLSEHGIHATIKGREKHLYSIHEKMQRRKARFRDVLDIYSFRVVVDKTLDCYTALGVLHMIYLPDLKRFKDHIAIPKSNSYQSLHTTLKGPHGLPLEVQIRTRDMDSVAENGITAIVEDSRNDMRRTKEWLQNILYMQELSADAKEFLENVKTDLYQNEVYVYTPEGKIIDLPRGATPVDFAYTIHTDIGNHCIAAEINRKPMPLRTQLKNGDQVKIITSAYGRPNITWLDFVVSGRARSAIRHAVKDSDYSHTVAVGKRMLDRVVSSMLPEYRGDAINKLYLRYEEASGSSIDDLLYHIGNGTLSAIDAFSRVLLGTDKSASEANLQIDAGDGASIFAEEQQSKVASNDLPVGMEGLTASVLVSSIDKTGLLAELTATVSRKGGNIAGVDTVHKWKNGTDKFIVFRFRLDVHDLGQLEQIILGFNQISLVRKVERE